MKFIDLHCDTASEIYYNNKEIVSNDLSVDEKKLIKGEALAQVFAFFIDLNKISNTPFIEFTNMYNNFISKIKGTKIKLVKNEKDIKDNIGAILSIEEGAVLEGNIDNVDKVYDMGIRIITLTWNYINNIGYPNYEYTYSSKGLTTFGKELILKLNEKGIIIDVSHLSDAGFNDVCALSTRPFIASHSNSREITSHYRNLTDDMIRKLSLSGGVMGINFCSDFLGDSKISKIDDMIRHIKHIKNVGSIDVIALGSDFDGILNEVEIKNASYMNDLSFALNKNGFTYDEIEKIFYKNAQRVLWKE